jgi:hypothetical protein
VRAHVFALARRLPFQRSPMLTRRITWWLSLALAGCAPPTLVPVVRTLGMPATPTPTGAVPLEVVTRATGVPDPLPVAGARAAFSELDAALGHAVSSAAVPWAEGHRGAADSAEAAAGDGGWRLLVELVHAEAEERDGRLKVQLAVRATLRRRVGNVYVAQTQALCREAALARAEEGVPVVDACVVHLGRDLAGWLGGVVP